MADSRVQRDSIKFGDFLRELSIELKSRDLDEMRLMSLAFDRVEEVLASLQEEIGIQVRRRADIVEEYRRRRQEIAEPVTHRTLDYTVRKDNVELQLEIKLEPPNGFSLEPDSVEQYLKILGANPKTEEIVLVWATEELDSLALDLDDILHWKRKAQPIRISKERLGPLKETIIATFQRHRPILQKPTDIRERRTVEFDLSKTFSKILEEKLGELRDSAERRRDPERASAIRSISGSDNKQIQILFSDGLMQDLSIDELQTRIEALCENVELG